MSFAQKEWPGGGRILMAGINTANAVSPGRTPLSGGVALVTGGSRGIGRAIAQRLAALGASVGICGRDRAALANSAEALGKTGVRVFSAIADVTRSADIANLIAENRSRSRAHHYSREQRRHGLFGPAHEKTEEEWDRVHNSNLKSVFLVSRAVVPSMIRRGAGDIINISSLAGKSTFANGGIYCASKWGVIGLSGCMAEDLRDHGIRVSVICPGSTTTEFSGRAPKDSSRALAPEDVAHAVETIVTQGPRSFISEVQVRPLRKP
jgi:NAD(P)-dependent dehydrogenase (short-subunit alcohol dehydrogenase family)